MRPVHGCRREDRPPRSSGIRSAHRLAGEGRDLGPRDAEVGKFAVGQAVQLGSRVAILAPGLERASEVHGVVPLDRLLVGGSRCRSFRHLQHTDHALMAVALAWNGSPRVLRYRRCAGSLAGMDGNASGTKKPPGIAPGGSASPENYAASSSQLASTSVIGWG